MNIIEIEKLNKAKLGIKKISILQTDHPVFKRGFIIDKAGCTIGRMVIKNDEFQYINWYKEKLSGPNINICNSDIVQLRFSYYLRTGRYASSEQLMNIVHLATVKAKKDYIQKINLRMALPELRPDGSRYKRKKIEIVNPRQRLQYALDKIIGD